jgi:hypothetical protein
MISISDYAALALLAMMLPAHAFDGKPVAPLVDWNADVETLKSMLFRAEQMKNAGSPLARALGEDELIKFEAKNELIKLEARTRR